MERHPYQLTNVLVAGRRLSGSALGLNPAEAVRRFTARQARLLGADVSAAIAGAVQAGGYKVEPLEAAQPATPPPAVCRAANRHLPAPDSYTEWPAMYR